MKYFGRYHLCKNKLSVWVNFWSYLSSVLVGKIMPRKFEAVTTRMKDRHFWLVATQSTRTALEEMLGVH